MLKSIRKQILRKRTILYVLIAIPVIYILLALISAVMMSQMMRITCNSGEFGETLEKLVIDFEDNTAQLTLFDRYGEQTQDKKISIDSSDEFQIKLVCSFSLFPLWRKDYTGLFSPLADDWFCVTRTYGNNESESSGQRMSYPLTYNIVIRALNRPLLSD